jgi:magnesium chelatase family protein
MLGCFMLAKLNTFALVGIEAVPVEVEVDASAGLPKTVLVGLPEMAVRESIHRIERALANLGYQRHAGRLVINLAPGDLKKEATAFDLPIALGMLVATGQLLPEQLRDVAVVGELALEGSVRPIKGALSMAMAARDRGISRLVVPSANAREAAVVTEVAVFGVGSLSETVGLLSGQLPAEPVAVRLEDLAAKLNSYEVDFADVRGQEFAKRAMIVAAGGGHNLLMLGAPGSGKTMLARRLPTILPPLTPSESLETTRIYSAMGRLAPGEALMATRPFRSPHHTISDAGMVGGGSTPAPGEISMAHHGVLFLDELPEFHRRSLEVLRQPVEEGKVTISRALNSTTFPASFILVAALNPCPCGFWGDPKRQCKCAPPQIERYMSRISGPLLDRIDMHIEVPAVPYQELAARQDGTSSAGMREQVLRARAAQAKRFGGDGHRLNGRMNTRQLRRYCVLDAASQALLKTAMESLGLSARAHDRILRVARTIADIEGAADIQAAHLTEAIGYRSLDRKLWAR